MKNMSLIWLAFALMLASCAKKDRGDDSSAVQQQNVEEQNQNQNANQNPNPQSPPPATTPAPQTVQPVKYPVIFHHGFMDAKIGRETNSEVANSARSAGANKIYYTEVSPANSIEFRGEQLAEEIDRILEETGAEKVNILAHSLGGLDARYAISSLGYEDKVASLSTVATPHRGTPVADLVIDYSPESLTAWIDTLFGFAGSLVSSSTDEDEVDVIAAVDNLSEEYMTGTFNPANPDSDKVFYQSWAGTTGIGTGHSTNNALKVTSYYLTAAAGANDGVVPESSARWGEYRGRLKADHIDLSGRTIEILGGDGFNFPKFIEIYIKDLVEKGY